MLLAGRGRMSLCRGSRPQPLSCGRGGATIRHAYRLTGDDGAAVQVEQARFVVGSRADADLCLPGLQPEHAELLQKAGSKQVFVRALVGESVFDSTQTFIDGDTEARPHVSYVLASGAQVAFGEQRQRRAFTVEFDEGSGSNPLVELMLQGMAASAQPAVRQALSEDAQ